MLRAEGAKCGTYVMLVVACAVDVLAYTLALVVAFEVVCAEGA
jgi:hypothetical protein